MGRYDEIIDLPHHISETRAQMPRRDRAAQFASFAALTGYEDGIAEAARLTESRLERSESDMRRLNERLTVLSENIQSRPEISVLYFEEDGRKSGGRYLRRSGRLRRIDESAGCLVFTDRSTLALSDIYELDGELFRENVTKCSIDM